MRQRSGQCLRLQRRPAPEADPETVCEELRTAPEADPETLERSLDVPTAAP